MATQPKILSTLRSITEATDWDAIFAAELPHIFNFFAYKTGNREISQDLTATTFERAWRARSRYRRRVSAPNTWLFGFARNVLKEYLRQHKKLARSTGALVEHLKLPADIDIEQSVQSQLDKVFLRGLLLELPEREQDLIALKYGAGKTNREIAQIIGLSESNVGTILHRTVITLRKKWNNQNG